jgi:hypothetical protein
MRSTDLAPAVPEVLLSAAVCADKVSVEVRKNAQRLGKRFFMGENEKPAIYASAVTLDFLFHSPKACDVSSACG